MSRKNQRWLAAAGLASALLLAVPAPSMAAGRWKPAAEAPSLAVRVWSWLESLGIVPRPLLSVREKEGSAIDPNGVPYVPPPPATSSRATTPMANPDDAQ
ncbi:MAG TPA: hypothetical protein VF789_20350 [Thermoanaerobaculia bacterium]